MKKLLTLVCAFVTANLAISQSLPSYVPSNGIIAWWPFNGNANDESGKGNNGTLYGATLTQDRLNQTNKAFNFTSDSILISNTNNFKLSKFTVSGWFKTSSSTEAEYHTLFNHFAGNSGSYTGYWLGVWSGKANLFLGSGTDEIDITGPKLVNDGNWHLITGIYDGSAGSVYLDGVLAGKSNFSMILKSEQTVIGNNFNNEDFEGDLDDIGVWDRVLTQQEITNLFTGGNAANKGILRPDAIRISPNPTNDLITIDLGHMDNVSEYELKIFNAVGQEVLSSGFEKHLSNYSIGHLPHGVYYLKVMNDSEVVSIQKVIKN